MATETLTGRNRLGNVATYVFVVTNGIRGKRYRRNGVVWLRMGSALCRTNNRGQLIKLLTWVEGWR